MTDVMPSDKAANGGGRGVYDLAATAIDDPSGREVHMDIIKLLSPDFSPEERRVLECGLGEWGGPASANDDIARAIGFESKSHMTQERKRLIGALGLQQPLAGSDWRRVLVATEIVFISDLIGSGHDWSTTTGISDETTVRLLRSIQRKVTGLAV